ncbi:MAG TPA: hypothetical protein DDZ51_19220 [Planctomycetaceae bacterium]|nr:hypothetical protein [Planctomycetaceae bacterium]
MADINGLWLGGDEPAQHDNRGRHGNDSFRFHQQADKLCSAGFRARAAVGIDAIRDVAQQAGHLGTSMIGMQN